MVNNVVRDMRMHARWAGLKTVAPLTVHTLRKSFAQNHADSGTPSATFKKLMGHATIITTEKHYLQRSDASEKAATQRYESLLEQKSADVSLTYEGDQQASASTPAQADASQHPASKQLG